MADEADPLVRDVLPRLAHGVRQELLELGEVELAAQVDELRVRQPCTCGDNFCQSFYTEPQRTRNALQPRPRTVPLLPDGVMVNLDVLEERIVHIEIIV